MGAPVNLYNNLAQGFRRYFPNAKLHILAWWDLADFGSKVINDLLQNSQAILLAHSAGGIIALQALDKFPANVKKLIMLDTHVIFARVIHILFALYLQDKTH